MLTYLFQWFGVTLTIAVCGGAFWKGARAEQEAAAGLLLSFAMTLALRDWKWQGIQWGAFASDACLLLLLTWIAIRSPRYWPLFAAAFQLLCVIIHVARLIDPGVRAWSYATGQVIFSQWVFLAVGVGTINTWRASRRQLAASMPLPTADPGATLR